MTARTLTRSLAATAVGAGVILAGGTAQAASAGSHSSPAKATAFVTPDGKLACAYNSRGLDVECVNSTAGWKHLKNGGLRDVDGGLVSDHPFRVEVNAKSGVALPDVSTQGPTFASVKSQTWHAKNGPVKHVRVTTNGLGDYVNQDFAVAKPGQTLALPGGITFTVIGQDTVKVTTHPTAKKAVNSIISSTDIRRSTGR